MKLLDNISEIGISLLKQIIDMAATLPNPQIDPLKALVDYWKNNPMNFIALIFIASLITISASRYGHPASLAFFIIVGAAFLLFTLLDAYKKIN